MKLFICLTLLGWSIAFAEQPLTRETICEPILIYMPDAPRDGKPSGYAHIKLYKRDLLNEGEYKIVAQEASPSPLAKQMTISGLKVKQGKSALIDTVVRVKDGGLGKYETTRNIYGVKFDLEADVSLDMDTNLDIGFGVKKSSKYTICTQYQYKPVN